ncbi:MAG: riboflavin kinase [archaeon]|nr:riboflavin kinase [archaeon]
MAETSDRYFPWKALEAPIEMRGEVKHGFGRGSKLLGFPTANIDIADSPGMDSAESGVYFGWGKVEDGPLIKAVVSVGWNPTFNDLKTKALEVYFVHQFPEDFYGRTIRVLVLGYVRQMLSFDGIDPLIQAIQKDVATSEYALDLPEFVSSRSRPFLT